MSVILDNITGGGLLPHVYCKKVTLETNQSDPEITDVTLLLELYQDKNKLSESSWLNSLSTQGISFMDAIFIQVLPFRTFGNVRRLLPSSVTLSAFNFSGPGKGSLYGGNIVYGDNYLPRGGHISTYALGDTGGNEIAIQGSDGQNRIFDNAEGAAPYEYPIAVSNSSLLGNISGADALLFYAEEGKIREEIVNGKTYYVIPFEYKYKDKYKQNSSGVDNSLGFAFYTFLHVPFWANLMEIPGVDYNANQSFFEEFVVEGSVNSEVVFLAGLLQTEREAFFLPNGRVWEGAAHVHSNKPWFNNPAPDGYVGDGNISGANFQGDFGQGANSEFRGWMVGNKHSVNEVQPKLQLARVPNNKLSDFRTSGILNGALLNTIDQQAVAFENLDEFEEKLAPIVKGVFQKDKKRYFIKDNDSEYSKLYVSKDKDGSARGLFFVNTEELLKNNSSLFGVLPNAKKYISSILNKSNLLEVKLYRDRVKKKIIGNRREKYANDEFYEEPSKLVATIPYVPSSVPYESRLGEVQVKAIGLSDQQNEKIRYFMFVDYGIAEKTAGLYQYKLELRFKDGTHDFLYQLYKDLASIKVSLDSYYDLSISTHDRKRYYQNGAFSQHFLLMANQMFPSDKPWSYQFLTPLVAFFDLINVQTGFSENDNNKMSPESGSPAGIEFYSKLAGIALKKIQILLGMNKVNKSGGNLTANSDIDGYSLKSLFETPVSPADYTIIENHTFGHPKELVEIKNNKNIYLDYLSVGAVTDVPAGQRLKVISLDDFRKRCQIESAKLSPLAKTLDGFKSANIGVDSADSLANTGYSYLAPSVVALSDPVEVGENYDFFYSAFKPNAYEYLDSDAEPSALYSSLFENLDITKYNLDKFLVALLNFSFARQDDVDADLTKPYFSYEAVENTPSGINNAALTDREPYKRALEQSGLTFHRADLHDKTFLDNGTLREPGAVSVDFPESDFKYDINDFSDGMSYPKELFLSFLKSGNTAISILSNSPAQYEYDISSPNNFKINYVATARPDDDILQPNIRDAFQNSNPRTGPYDALYYFMLNLTVKIEVYTGRDAVAGNAKNDEGSWQLLTGGVLDFIESATESNKVLFCRMSLYDENLDRNIILPILNEYFFIDPGAAAAAIAQSVSLATESQINIASDTFWQEQNDKSMKEYAEETGNSFEFDGGFQGVGASNVQSSETTDPVSPTSQSEQQDTGYTPSETENKSTGYKETANQEGSDKGFGGYF